MLGPAHQGILIQARIEPLLTLVCECHPLAAADPTQRIGEEGSHLGQGEEIAEPRLAGRTVLL
jgi:hypothetical protein